MTTNQTAKASARIYPERMADMYWYRLRLAALPVVRRIIHEFQGSKNTKEYWFEVYAAIESKANNTKGYAQ